MQMAPHVVPVLQRELEKKKKKKRWNVLLVVAVKYINKI